MRCNVLMTAIAAGLGLISFAAAAAPVPAETETGQVTVSNSELQQMKAQISALQHQLGQLQAQPVQTVSVAPGDVLDNRVDKLEKLLDDTSVSGKMYFNFSSIDQKNSDTGKTDNSGLGLDVKRFYLGVTHQFDDIWSANLTTDFNYVGNDDETNLFVKKAYVQGKFDPAAVLRIGSADMPWIPFVENYYGYRYVENTLTDRLHYANSADWGLHLGGDIGAGKHVNYAVSVVNGGGYKHPSRSKGVDFAGRVGFVPFDGMVVAVGGYSGKLGEETENVSAPNTARRGDVMVAYAGESFRLGGEYFTAKNWNNVLSPRADKADGYSLWASVALADDLSLFGRYDSAKLSKNLDREAQDVYYNLGLEYQVSKGFKLAAVWKHEKGDKSVTEPIPSHVQTVKTNEIGVWGEVAF